MPGKEYYEVDTIVDHREGSKGTEFLVRWAHYTPAEDTWEPVENLKNCDDIIAKYMDKENKRLTRRSMRLSQANQLENQQVKMDAPVTRPRRKPREPAVTRTTRSTTKTKARGKTTDTASTQETYSNRSVSRKVDFSDDEDDVTMLSATKPLPSRKPLSESKFRKEIGGLFSSTPYSSSDKEAPGFDEYDMQQKVTVTTIQTHVTDKNKAEEVLMGEADSDDDEVIRAQQKQDEEAPPPVPPTEQTPSWMVIGWKEVALATVLTGIGVVGYVCHVTDYCSYCF